MKKLIPILIFIPSLISPVSAYTECLNGWCLAGCFGKGECIYVKRRSIEDWPVVDYLTKSPNGMFAYEANCHTYKARKHSAIGKFSTNNWGPWESAMPGSLGKRVIDVAYYSKNW